MPIPRILMLLGLLLLPAGFAYALSIQGARPKHASYVEHSCLLLGAGVFYLGLILEKKKGR